MKNYIQKIRSKIGQDKFIHPAARIIVENEVGQILVIEKQGSGQIGIPAGAFEENETITDCIKREVKEETGLTLLSLQVIGISSNPIRETVNYTNGDCIQYFTIEFFSKHWEGSIQVQDKEEIARAWFAHIDIIDQLPKNEQSTFESLKHYRQTNQVLLK